MEQEQGIRIASFAYACSSCSGTLGKRPTQQIAQHVCPHQHRAVSSRSKSFAFKCSGCGLSFSSRKGRDNHESAHRRQEARERLTTSRRSSNCAIQPPCEEISATETYKTANDAKVHCSVPPGHSEHDSYPHSEQGSPNPLHTFPDAPSEEEAGDALSDPMTRNSENMAELLPPNAASQDEVTMPPSPGARIQDSPPPTPSHASQLGKGDADSARQEIDGAEETTDRQCNTADSRYPLAEHLKNIQHLSRKPENEETWKEFDEILTHAEEAVTRHVRLPEAADRTRPPVNPENPKQIQALHRRNRRQAVRLITQGKPTPCDLPQAEVAEYSQKIWSEKTADISPLHDRRRAQEEVSLHKLTAEEVLKTLRKCENTTPGDDRLTYNHWKAADPDCRVVAAVFNTCMRFRRVPRQWKRSRVVLIHKKGSREDISSWRPISLIRTIAKLYTGCLASRVLQWVMDNEVISKCQKGFMPYDGVLEHNFVVQERLERARTTKTDLYAGFLDFSNAFGSIPHHVLTEAAGAAGAGQAFCDIIGDLYRDNEATVVCHNGTTDYIPVKAGIRQGCPISGLLFKLVVDVIVRKVQGMNEEHNILTYADDLTPLADTAEALQARIDTVECIAGSIGLKLNPSKCRTLHMSEKHPVGLRHSLFTVRGTPIPPIQDGETFNYLGRPVGFNVMPDGSTITEAIELGRKLLESLLAPWQRLDAVKTFLYSGLNFAMRMRCINKTEWKRLDDAMRPLINRTLHVPESASTDYIHGSSQGGACGIPDAAELSNLCRIDTAYKLLTSPDPAVANLAASTLSNAALRRAQTGTTAPDVAAYPSGAGGIFDGPSRGIRNTWTEARKASKRASVMWEFRNEGPHLTKGEVTIGPAQRNEVISTLRRQLTATRDNQLRSLPSQGKVLECVALDRSSSQFMRTGMFTRFADWRFIHLARLNLPPLNGARPWDNGD
ncbi:uncharacterized protein LOC135376960 [Ornithodoros turicata]|uniref:uncharacterized protein LOC135376960 n=1 Tax=Ornithodoros turicata TaxID=34597 RepID=UPI0031391B25